MRSAGITSDCRYGSWAARHVAWFYY